MKVQPDFLDDFIDHEEEELLFLKGLNMRFPRGYFHLVSHQGRRHETGEKPPMTALEIEQLIRKAKRGTGTAQAMSTTGTPVYGMAVDFLNAILIFCLDIESLNDGAQNGAAVVMGLCIELFVTEKALRAEKEALVIQKRQLDRRFHVLEDKYREILEDNQRGYQIIQEQQEKYSKTLKAEIERQTEELRRTNDELRRSRAAAEAANNAKSAFLASMSHELRTPMNGVIGYTEMLMDSNLDHELKEYAQSIKHSSEALLTLINDILDFSKIEAGQIDLETIEFDPELIAYDVCDIVRPRMIKKPVEILCRIDHDVPAVVKGDPVRFRQVLVNLMGNAVKFTEAGEIELRVSVEEEIGNHIRLHAQVRDTGIGIPEEKLETIFEAFKQADNSTTREYGGTGLGLSICKKIAGLMNGNVWAESRMGKGSTFHFTSLLEKSDHAPSSKYFPASLRGKKVLIVDDNESNLEILSYFLQSVQMRVTASTRESEALPALLGAQKGGDPFDLCILDIFMPNRDGYEVAARVRQSDPPVSSVPLLAFSSSMVYDSQRFKDAGFNGFLPKPIRREKLFRMAERLIGNPFEQSRRDDKDKKVMTQHLVHEKMKRAVNILLAEDNPVNQRLTKIVLTKAGYGVDLAHDGQKAVEKYKGNPSAYQLILMDIQMPLMDGLKATEAIRRHESLHPDINVNVPIVALTANAVKGDREKCLASGMNDYVTKPIKREEIYRIIKKWVLEKEGP